MKCTKCGEVKLWKEFAPFTLNEDCDHPPLHCLRCVTTHWQQTKQCSHCDNPVADSSLNLRKCFSTLKILFPEVHTTTSSSEHGEASVESKLQKFTVILLNGEASQVIYNPALTIRKVKGIVQKALSVTPDKQRLVYHGTEMKDMLPGNKEATLSTYNVKPGDTVHLMVLLYAVPSSLNKVVFDLHWGYPSHGTDFLDASALVFSGQAFVEVVDYSRRSGNIVGEAIRHSGDLMDDNNRIGHHIIHVELQKIPANVTSVFFTLSAWSSPTISHFKTPSLKFFELSKPDKMLCTDQTKSAGHRQAIVMCSLTRRGGQWNVDSNGALSSGNARQYDPLVETIKGVIATMGQ